MHILQLLGVVYHFAHHTAATLIHGPEDIAAEWCGNGHSSEELVNTHLMLHKRDLEQPELMKRDRTRFLLVDVWYHIVTDDDAADPSSVDYITDKMIAAQHKYMQDAYVTAGIDLLYQGTTRTINETWASNGDDVAMKAALREGGYDTMNVYVQTQFQGGANTPNVPKGSTLLGLGTFPAPYILRGVQSDAHDSDGVSLYGGAITGGTLARYNTGAILVHESGHWLGLYHVFRENSCAATSYGDFVFDTPQTSQATNGCPVGKDSCPDSGYVLNNPGPDSTYGPQGLAGLDPINNFMDYSDGSCLNTFTLGQGYRAFNLFIAYRVGR